MKKIINKLKNLKFELIKLDKVDVLLLDDNYANLKFDKNIKVKLKESNKINLIVLIKAIKDLIFLKNKRLSDSYFINYIKEIEPKVSIGHEYNGQIFRLKKFFPKKKTILYQLADQSDFFKKTAKKMICKDQNLTENLKSDYFLAKNNYSKNFYNFIESKFMVAGSIKNNEIKVKSHNKEYDIMFISQFRKKVEEYHGTNNNIGSMRTVDTHSSFICKILNNLSKKKNLKIALALTSTRKDKSKKFKLQPQLKQDEKDFFKRDLENFYHEDVDSTFLAAKSKLIITVNSTLGLELLSRGMKVIILDLYHYIGGSPLENLVKGNSGLFWFRENRKDLIEKKIIDVLETNFEDWKRDLDKINPMIFDEDNKILKDLVFKLLQTDAAA